MENLGKESEVDLGQLETVWKDLGDDKTSTPMRKSRRSWFDKNPGASFQIAVEKKVKPGPTGKRKSDAEIETLLLTHFTNPPRIGFGKAKPGLVKTRSLLIKNPHEYEQSVKVEKFPYKKNFSIDNTEFTVDPESCLMLTITWQPENEGNFREMILFLVDSSYRLQAFVFGTSEAPPKKKKVRGKGLLGTRVKNPFTIVQTPNLANIAKAYSPEKGKKKRKSAGKVSKENVVKTTEDVEFTPIIKIPVDFEPKGNNDTEGRRRSGHRRSSTYRVGNMDMSPIKAVAVPVQENVQLSATEDKENVEVVEEVVERKEQQPELCKMEAYPVCESEREEKITPQKSTLLSAAAPREFVSPNSFLQDSLCMQQEMGNFTGITSVVQQPAHSTVLPTPERHLKDPEVKRYVSPNSFLKDLNITQEAAENQSSDSIPSPSAILNESVPHDIMVRQLKYVKTNLSDNKPRQKEGKVFEFSAKGKPGGSSKTGGCQIQRGEGKNKKSEIRRETFVRKVEPRRNTFVKKTSDGNPFSVVPEGTSPRRTTFLVKGSNQKLQNKRQQYVRGTISCSAANTKRMAKGNSLSKSKVNTETKITPVVEANDDDDEEFTKIRVKSSKEDDNMDTPIRSVGQDHTSASHCGKKDRRTWMTENCYADVLPTPERLILGDSHTVKKQRLGSYVVSDVIENEDSIGPEDGLDTGTKSLQHNVQSSLVLATPERHLESNTEPTVEFENEVKDHSLNFSMKLQSSSAIPTPERNMNLEAKTSYQRDSATISDATNDKSDGAQENSGKSEMNLPELQSEVKKVTQGDNLVLPTPERHLTSDLCTSDSNGDKDCGREAESRKFGGSLTVSKETAGTNQMTRNENGGDIVLPTPERFLQSPSSQPYSSYNRTHDNKVSSGKQLFSPGNLSSSFGSPKRLPDSPLLRDITHCATMTTTKSRPSDALMEATTRNRAACLFQDGATHTDSESQNTKEEDSHCRSIQEEEDDEISFLVSKYSGSPCSSSAIQHQMPEHQQQDPNTPGLDKSDSFSGTPKQLPTSPNPDRSRRSTHVVENPKVVNVSAVGRKKLFPPLEDDNEKEEGSERGEVINGIPEGKDVVEGAGSEIVSKHANDNDAVNKSSGDFYFEDEKLGNMVTREKSMPDPVEEGNNIGDTDADSNTSNMNDEDKSTGDLDLEKNADGDDIEDKENRKPVYCSLTNPESTEKSDGSQVDKKGHVEFISFAKESTAPNTTNTARAPINSVKRVTQQTKENNRKRQRTEVLQQDRKMVTRQQTKLSRPEAGDKQRAGTVKSTSDRRTVLPSTAKGKPAEGPKTLMKGVAKSKLILMKKSKTVIPKHPMPFASKNMYYDERWMEKQERGFVHWLNFVLTPEDYQQTSTKTKVDAGKLFVDSNKNTCVKLAPSKEVLSFREYGARRRLNHLRKASCRLFQTEAVVRVVQKLEAEIESSRLIIRKDRMVHADLGLKQSILDMLLSFNPLWLRVGLETCFGEMILVQSNSDVIGLSRFIITRLLANPEIAQEYAHPTVPHLYRDGYATAIARHLLKKFLMVVFFLDFAKRQRLIHHDPCLFCRDAEFKTCKAMLIEFSRNYLAGEGDVTRHLGYLGYSVTHVQTPLDEFDYAVSNLASDLRDGLRLNRVLELLCDKVGETKKLRVPAISRLQKIHNMEIFFQALAAQGIEFEKDGLKVQPRDIVDGHKEKTLCLLWSLIIQYQVQVLVNEEQLREEINILEKSLKVKNQLEALQRYEQGLQQRRRESAGLDLHMKNKLLGLVLKWCRIVCAFYGMKIENFTVSFGDGRALCYLVNHYHPALLPRSNIRTRTMMTYQEDLEACNQSDMNDSISDSPAPFPVPEDPSLYDQLLANEKENFKVLYERISELGGVPLMLRSADMSNTIPDEKVVVTYITYLCARLLDIRHESRAARVIQLAWRRYHLKKSTEHLKRKETAAMTIQRAVRRFLLRAHAANLAKKRVAAAITIQKAVRSHLQRVHAANTIKRHLLAYTLCQNYRRQRRAAITIQTRIRGYLARARVGKMHQAAQKIQVHYLQWKLTRQVREEYLCTLQAIMKIQRAVKTWLQKVRKRRAKAAIRIQACWRRHACYTHYVQLKSATVKVQSAWRTKIARSKFTCKRRAAVLIQQRFRAQIQMMSARENYVRMRKACLTIQTRWRTYLKMRHEEQHRAATIIQACYRGYKEKSSFKEMREAAVIIQKHVKCQQQHRRFLMIREATLSLQHRIRGYLVMKRYREQYRTVKASATLIAGSWKTYQCRKNFTAQKRAAIKIQSAFRGWRQRSKFIRLKGATLAIQKRFREYLLTKKCVADYTHRRRAVQLLQASIRAYLVRKYCCRMIAARTIQKCYRAHRVHKSYQDMKKSAVAMQAMTRMISQRRRYLEMKRATIVIQRQFRATSVMKTERTEFQRKKAAAIAIQACYRGYLARKNFQRTRRSAIKIQSHVKGYLKRRNFLKVKMATSVLQTRFRALLLCRKAQREFLVLKGAAITIQAVYRGYRVMKSYQSTRKSVIIIQSHVKAYLERRRFSHVKMAAITLQRRYRALVMAQKAQREFLIQKGAALTIQAAYRGYRARTEFRKVMKCVVKMQSVVRMHLAKNKFQQMKKAAVNMQRRYRAKMLAQRVKRDFLLKRGAIITIQAFYRGHQERQRYMKFRRSVIKLQAMIRMLNGRRNYQQLKSSARTIQERFRAKLLGEKTRRKYLICKGAAITIQAQYRGYCARRTYQAQREAAIRIQSFVRMCLIRKRFLAQRSASVIIQTRFRAVLEGRKIQREYFIKKGAVITIQAFVRGHLARKHYERVRDSVIRIQASVKSMVARWRFIRVRHAALVIQNRFRANLTGNHVREDFLRKKNAALTIQKFFRGSVARQQTANARRAVVKFQSMFRMYRHRKYFTQLKQSALVIQTRLRARLLAKRVQNRFLIMRGAAITIQSNYRKYVQRETFLRTMAAAVRLQAVVRGYLIKKKFVRMRQACVVIQRRYHDHLVAKHVRQTFLMKKRAAVTLQANFRGFKVRQELCHANHNATIIQSAFRRHYCRKMFLHKKAAAVCVQRWFRNVLVSRKDRRNYLQVKSSTVIIQKAFRSHVARKAHRNYVCSVIKLQAFLRMRAQCRNFQKLKSAVMVCQRRYRESKLSQKVQRDFLIRKGAAITVQAFYRGHKVRTNLVKKHRAATVIQANYRCYTQRRDFLKQKMAAIRIQTFIRSHNHMKQIQKEFQQTKSHIVKVQSSWRSFTVRRQYKQTLKSVVKIQTLVRGYLQWRRYVQIKNAVVLCQSHYRAKQLGKRVLREFLIKKGCAMTIQAFYRGHLVRKQLGLRQRSATLLQAHYRGWKTRAKLNRQKAAAICIQRAYRLHMRKKEMEKRRKQRLLQLETIAQNLRINMAAIHIQRFYRKTKALQLAREQLHSVLLIQNWFRGRLQRIRYLKFCQSVIRLQAMARLRLRKRARAAAVIQRGVRQWLLRRQQLKRTEAATTIQAMWRGRQVRKRNRNRKLELLRQRIEEANKSATEDKKLGNRAASALDFLLKYKQLSQILEALMHLDVATRLSSACCLRLVEVNAVQVIYTLLRSCNRSQPHMEIIKYAISILLNLAKYEKTVDAVYIDGAVDTLVELMQIYREKGLIFNQTCTLLGILGMNLYRRMEMTKDTRVVEKIRSIHLLTARKNKITETRMLRQAKLDATKSFNSTLPVATPHKKQHKIRPAWVLNRDRMHEINNPMQAINFVMDCLCVKPK